MKFIPETSVRTKLDIYVFIMIESASQNQQPPKISSQKKKKKEKLKRKVGHSPPFC